MDQSKIQGLLGKIIWIIVCAVLLIAIAVFLIVDHQTTEVKREELERMSAADKKASAVLALQIAEEWEEETDAAGETGEEPEEESGGEAIEGEDTEGAEERPMEAETIACWGDAFFRGEEAQTNTYQAQLQELLEENGYPQTVADKTLAGASTLSVMKMAGVGQEELDAYIEAHREEAGDEELAVTETGIRDLTEEQMERTEADGIPVICMGYYGGWNHDLEELAEQQQKVLDTFGENKDRFLIIGIRPMNGNVSSEDLDGAMEEAWGEHYISAAKTVSGSAVNTQGQREIAQAVFDRLVELEYIKEEER